MMTSADRARAYQLMREEGPFEVDEYIKLSSKEYLPLPDEGRYRWAHRPHSCVGII